MTRELIFYGRCRSGKRWFWAASVCKLDDQDQEELFGWDDTEPLAFVNAQAAVSQLAKGRDVVEHLSHGYASIRLKKINAERRRSRPAPDTTGSHRVEYLYALSYGEMSGPEVIR